MKNLVKKLLSSLCVLATLSCYGCGLLWGDSDSSSGGETVIENGFVDEIFNGNYTQISGEELAELAKTVEEGSPKRIFSVNEGVIVRRMGEGTGDAHIGDGTPLSSSTSRTLIQKGEGISGSYRAQCNSTEKDEGSLYGEYSSYDDGTTLYTKQWRDRSDTEKEKTDSEGLESYYSIFTLLGGMIGEGSEESEGFEVTESSSSSTVTTASGGTKAEVEREITSILFNLEKSQTFVLEGNLDSMDIRDVKHVKNIVYRDTSDSDYIKIKVELTDEFNTWEDDDGDKFQTKWAVEEEYYFIYSVKSRELVAYSYKIENEQWQFGKGSYIGLEFSIAPWSGTITPPSDLDTYGAGEDNSTEGGTPTAPPDEMEELAYEVVGDYAVCRGMGTATNTDIVIASTYQGKPVARIGDGAFSDCTSLTSVSIPDSVITIGKGAFYGCTNLASVSIPDSVTTIGGYAFYGCTNLASVSIPDSVTTIGNSAFSSCTSLTGVYITDIAKWCTVNFGDEGANPLPYAGNLYVNNQLVTDLIIPAGVTTIGYGAFGDCTSLTSITIPGSIITIGESAFHNCTSLASIIIPNGVTTIGERAFAGCANLTVYAEAAEQPSGWDSEWNSDNRPVEWGYTGV